MERGTTPSPFF
jgi:hypothetical protein